MSTKLFCEEKLEIIPLWLETLKQFTIWMLSWKTFSEVIYENMPLAKYDILWELS